MPAARPATAARPSTVLTMLSATCGRAAGGGGRALDGREGKQAPHGPLPRAWGGLAVAVGAHAAADPSRTRVGRIIPAAGAGTGRAGRRSAGRRAARGTNSPGLAGAPAASMV